MNTVKITDFFKKNIDTAQTALQGCLMLTLGIWMTFSPAGFVSSLGTVGIIVVSIQLFGNILCAIGAIFKGFKAIVGRCIDCIITFLVLCFLISYPRFIFTAFPLLIGLYSLLLGVTHLIVFLQYMHEHNTRPLRQAVFCAICFIFGLSCLGALAAHIEVSLTFIGVYFILFALTLFADFAISLVPRERKNRMKRRIRFQLPVFVAALVPRKVLGEVNKYFETTPDIDKVALNSQKPERGTANVEVFVHVSPDGMGSMGHVDLCIEGRCISYGGYDEKAMKLSGGIGPGVLFEHENKEEYIKLCKKQSNKTLFGFGLSLSDEEIARINQKLADIKKNTYEWMPKAHLADIGQAEQGEYTDYGSLLYRATNARFYKFSHGSFKYYFVLGTNCVKLADTLLGACGTDAVVCGIISPGTYYDFLNREYVLQGGTVVSRIVY